MLLGNPQGPYWQTSPRIGGWALFDEHRGCMERGTDMTIARRMARWANALTYDALPRKTVNEVKPRVIASIATALGAYHAHPAKDVRAKAMAVSVPPPAATV